MQHTPTTHQFVCLFVSGSQKETVSYTLISNKKVYIWEALTHPIAVAQNKRILICKFYVIYNVHFFLWRCDPTRGMASSFLRFLNHTQQRITVGRTALDEWSARRRDLYLTTHNTHNRQTSMPPMGFEPTISAGERPQTYALDRAATGTGITFITIFKYINTWHCTSQIDVLVLILLCIWDSLRMAPRRRNM